MNLTSSRTLRLLFTTVALTLGANAQSAKPKDYDFAWNHPEQYTNSFNSCIDQALAHPKYQDALEAQFPCYELETAIQDRRLNINYKLAIASKKPAEQTALRMYERAWIELRTNTCAALENKTRVGTARRITMLFARDCTLQWTRERADQLEGK